MKRYIDGFVLPIPKARLSEYQAIAEAACTLWKEYGAVEYWECAGDDLQAECSRSFVEMTNAQDEETIIFAWAVFESREARDAANEKILADPRMAEIVDQLANPARPIVDFSRLAHGGFKVLVRG